MCHYSRCEKRYMSKTQTEGRPGSFSAQQCPFHILPWPYPQREDTWWTHGDLPAPWCLPTSTSAPTMQPIPRMQTTIPMKCTALYRISRKNQESKITTGITKQSRSYGQEGKEEQGVQEEAFHAVKKHNSSVESAMGSEPEVLCRAITDAIKTDSETISN